MIHKFIAEFGLPFNGFLAPVKLTDAFGFSTLKKSPTDFASLFKVIISEKNMQNKDPNKQLRISANYGKKMENGISLGSTDLKSSIIDPIGLESNEDFSYNIETGSFFIKMKKLKLQKF